MIMKKLFGLISIIFALIASILFALGITLILLENVIFTEIKRDELDVTPGFIVEDFEEEKPILPDINTKLSKENMIKINSITLNSEIIESKSADIGLEKGIWRVYNFGTPEDNKPIILAAHRYGLVGMIYKELHNNSFYNLPKAKVGDKIYITWNQREYIFEIVDSTESTKISSYNYDLILYTCKSYNTPIRIFKYANRIN